MATKKISFGRPSQTAKTSTPSQAEMDAWVSAGAETKKEENRKQEDKKVAMKRIVLEVDEETHKKFKMLCTNLNCTVSSVLRSHIDVLLSVAPDEVLKK